MVWRCWFYATLFFFFAATSMMLLVMTIVSEFQVFVTLAFLVSVASAVQALRQYRWARGLDPWL